MSVNNLCHTDSENTNLPHLVHGIPDFEFSLVLELFRISLDFLCLQLLDGLASMLRKLPFDTHTDLCYLPPISGSCLCGG